jgi:flagellar protein FlbT
MSLKLTLKPSEKFIVNGAVLQNGDRRVTITIENRASILREKDIMMPEDAVTPARRIYFAIMMLYLEETENSGYADDFVGRMTEFMNAISSPEAVQDCVEIIQNVHSGKYYKALHICRKLFPFEAERLGYVASDVPEDTDDD